MGLFVVVEGEGDREAVPVLVAKLGQARGIHGLPHISAGGVAVVQLHLDKPNGRTRLEKRAETYRARRGVTALLVTQDSEDTCPRDLAPEVAGWIRALRLPFPVALVLFYREYETMFLAASGSLQGQRLRGAIERPGLPSGAVYSGDPERPRDAKGWMSQKLGRRYVETLDQSAFTRTLDLADQALGRLASFRRLATGLEFLGEHASSGRRGKVYP